MDFYSSGSPLESNHGLGPLPENTFWLDGLEVVQQQTPQIRAYYRHPVSDPHPRFERPIRRRLRPEEGRVKLHQTFTMTTVPAVGSRGGLDSSDLCSSSSPATIVTSSTSSAGTPWSTSGRVEEIFEDEGDYSWDDSEHHYQQDDAALVPKLEPTDEPDMDLYEVDDSVMQTPLIQSSSMEVPIKRRRGRPRKHPKIEPESTAKVHKGRSKTGCVTCRQRKKKCDETKPFCIACQKNGSVCLGYRPLQHWKSGKEKKEEERRRREEAESAQRRNSMIEVPTFPLPPLIICVETPPDRIFFKHYTDRLSIVYTVESDAENSFRKIFLPVAQNNEGLMHSILSIASQHIDYSSAYGRQILRDNPNVTKAQLEERSDFHRERACEELCKAIASASEMTKLGHLPGNGRQQELSKRKNKLNLSAAHLQVVLEIISTLGLSKPTGQHRIHLKYGQMLPLEDEDPQIRDFVHEFYQYHILADQITSLPQAENSLHDFHQELNFPRPMLQSGAVLLLGVSDQLLLCMSRVTNLRNQIRENMEAGIDPPVPYGFLYQATEIDACIREWTPVWSAEDRRDLVGKIHQLMIYVYLQRTVYPPLRSEGWNISLRITESVDAGIALLSLVEPRSTLQTVCLAPAFVFGCAAFEPKQRQEIRRIIAVIESYMEYKNTETSLKVLEEVWRLMDLHDERSWDCQTIAHTIGVDFLPT